MRIRMLSLAMNALIVVIVLAAWLGMVFSVNERGVLTSRGLHSLKYFTVLSNLLACAASAAYGVCLIRSGAAVPRGVVVWKYAGTVSVALTLATTALFLGPTARTGYLSMFQGVNFWLHLVAPALCILDFCLWNPDGPLTLGDSLLACTPMALYAAYYVGNLLCNGIVGRGGRTNDWYGFAAGGWGMAGVAAAIICLATWGMALLMRLPRK